MKSSTRSLPIITFTGERHNDHFQIALGNKPVELTCSALQALIRLVIGRGTTQTGFVPMNRVIISRLRQALNDVILDLGEALIETGCGEEYRLTIPPESLASSIVLDPSFLELEVLKVVLSEQVTHLRRFCHIRKPK